MRKVNRVCIVCGKNYDYCSGCAGSDPSWKAAFCCENCREISHVLSNYCANMIDSKDAYNLLSKCDLSYSDKFKDNTKKVISDILGNNSPVVEENEQVESEIDSDTISEIKNVKVDYRNANKKKKNKNNKKRK